MRVTVSTFTSKNTKTPVSNSTHYFFNQLLRKTALIYFLYVILFSSYELLWANQNKSFLYVELRLILICNVMLRPASLFLTTVPAGSESTAWHKQTKMDKR